ncbi:hypothetical protein CAOG_02479 [Capsaspora owczarzaki ATCC 30864]|uniref:Conserved oligomeric Golgi complex subunit 8 n=1 Tax=Capsaspora owczarzaki (strain ATCC 30864) TaxID=595528 RepID=A0A0D2VME3_CAPO3|nr:hypothetical protein CAOG_02479 [Capsaspora owczarzaki ATCC 30864]KJE91327.1 hypothetical protein CAOG_002479 [Capsaspora owczarzaki ATCC 30864]|eukprot:XP_004349229.2 hypothetical protein CAOG_02479 [Capsaspora owczarzaki ATCC 30864]
MSGAAAIIHALTAVPSAHSNGNGAPSTPLAMQSPTAGAGSAAVTGGASSDAVVPAWATDPECAAYVDELTAFSVEQLQRQPLLLATQRRDLIAQTQSLAVKNYKAFIQTAECSRTVSSNFDYIETRLGNLIDTLPRFTEACERFVEASKEIAVRRKEVSLTLDQHAQLVDILELPQLMDTCVRNGYYDEALEVDAYVQRFVRRHRDIKLVMSIADEVARSKELLLSQLLSQLRGALQLPACLRVVGYLRRLGTYSESDLRATFLEARDHFLHASLPEIKSPNTDLSRYVDACRVHLFDIITQYRAIFTDDWQQLQQQQQQQQQQQLSSSPNIVPASPRPGFGNLPTFLPLSITDPLTQQQLQLFIQKQQQRHQHQQGRLLLGWVVERVASFVATLEANLAAVSDGATVASLLGQCMYFGMSLGRVGIDFRTLLVPLFEHRALELFAGQVATATAKFAETMSSCSAAVAAVQTQPGQPVVYAGAAGSGAGLAGANAGATAAAATLVPPSALMEFPAVALLANGFTAAFNELRHCAPLSIATSVHNLVQISVQEASKTVSTLVADAAAGGDPREQQALAAITAAMQQGLVPYVTRCLVAVYPDLKGLRGFPSHTVGSVVAGGATAGGAIASGTIASGAIASGAEVAAVAPTLATPHAAVSALELTTPHANGLALDSTMTPVQPSD